MGKKSKHVEWTEKELEDYRSRRKDVGDPALQEALSAFQSPKETILSIKKSSRVAKTSSKLPLSLSEVLLAASPEKKKRRGVSVRPIMDSLREPKMTVWAGHQPNGAQVYSVWLEGARVLTINELISIYQYRKFETYAYKKRWKELMEKSVEELLLQTRPPFFESKTRLVLYRRGKRLIDLDSLPAVFKYATDGLKKAGLIAEDNPNVIVEVVPIQEKGEPAIGLRLEEMPDWNQPLQDWKKVWHLPQLNELNPKAPKKKSSKSPIKKRS